MSEENKDPFDYEINHSTFPFFNNNPTQNPQGFEYPMSFTDCLHGSMDYNTLSRAFDMSCSPSHQVIEDNLTVKKAPAGVGESTENLSPPNSSLSCSSNEAAPGTEEESVKKDGDHEEKSKKG